MIVLLSPTKQMDFHSPLPASIDEIQKTSVESEPPFLPEAKKLNELLGQFDTAALASLMKTSEKLTEQTEADIRRFNSPRSPEAPERPSILAYSGTVFQALDPRTLTAAQLMFAQRQLILLSGLYGVLHPLSRIRPYRLEMKTALNLTGGESLTSFWKSRVSDYLRIKLNNDSGIPVIVNLSSGEYSKVLDLKVFNENLLNFHFKENNGGILRTVGMYAKTARGLMARRILMEMTDDPETLKKGHTGGYRFDRKISSEKDWVFVR